MSEVIGRIEHIAIYPVKSAHRVEVQQAKLTPDGVSGDRRFMIVRGEPDADGVFKFVTQRDKRDKGDVPQGFSDLTQIRPIIHGDNIFLSWGERYDDSLEIDERFKGKEVAVAMHDDEVVLAVDQGNKVATWLSDHLGTGLRLVRKSGSFERRASQTYVESPNHVRFQDAYPVHWFFQESVDELIQLARNSDEEAEAQSPISWKIFRPNIVAVGSPAQTEHLVYQGEIADIPFVNAKPCDRCPVTNVDQGTGKVIPGRALTTLGEYKRWINIRGKQKVIFGENMLPQRVGDIWVGDEIVLIDRRDPPLVYGAKV